MMIMPALTYKAQGHAHSPAARATLHRQAALRTLKPACPPARLPGTFLSSLIHHCLTGKMPQLETAHTANSLALLMRTTNTPAPALAEATQARIASLQDIGCGPHTQALLARPTGTPATDQQGVGHHRLLIPALAATLDEREATPNMPIYTSQ